MTKWLFEIPSFLGQMTRCFLFVFRITGYRFFLYSILFKAAVARLMVQRLTNNKTVMAKRTCVTADELLSILCNLSDNISDCEDSGAELDDLHIPDLFSILFPVTNLNRTFQGASILALVYVIILLNDLGLKINLKRS